MITKKEFDNLKNFDFVQVKVNGEWVNGVVEGEKISTFRGDAIYIRYKDLTYSSGMTNYFLVENIRLPNFNIDNNEIISEIKTLANKLKIKEKMINE